MDEKYQDSKTLNTRIKNRMDNLKILFCEGCFFSGAFAI